MSQTGASAKGRTRLSFIAGGVRSDLDNGHQTGDYSLILT